MHIFQTRTALRYFLPLAIISIATVALLPGDKDAQPSASIISEAPARPSYLVDVPELQTTVATAGVASLTVEPAAPVATEQNIDPMTTASISPETAAFPMDEVPDAEAGLAVEPALAVGEADASVVSAVNMRAGPSTSTQTLMVLKAGEPLRVIETSGGWVNVALADGTTGWVYSRYVSGAGIPVEERVASSPRVVDVQKRDETPIRRGGVRLATDVAVRAGPGRGAQRLFRVDEGERVAVIEQRGDWVRISTGNGPSGWVRRGDLTR
jgi:SH3-like domain-containing protein